MLHMLQMLRMTQAGGHWKNFSLANIFRILQMIQMLQMMYPCACGLLAAFDARTVPLHSLIVRERSSGGRNARS